MARMDYEHLSSKTQFDLTNAKSLDFARLVGLQARFAHLPDPHWYALRNFRTEFPRSLHLDLIQKPRRPLERRPMQTGPARLCKRTRWRKDYY